MQIHLRHPKHGIKIATLEDEAAQDIRSGWEIYNPNAPKDPPKRRRGRPRKVKDDADVQRAENH